MRLVVAAIGHLKRGPEADLINDYSERASVVGRQLGLKGLVVKSFDAPKALTGARRQQKEAELLCAAVPPAAATYILDEHGKPLKSMGFAQELEHLKDNGTSECVFLIGGADGHGAAVKELEKQGRAKTISFGTATWPHMLVRVMLCEQLYRATTILANHPYHRE